MNLNSVRISCRDLNITPFKKDPKMKNFKRFGWNYFGYLYQNEKMLNPGFVYCSICLNNLKMKDHSIFLWQLKSFNRYSSGTTMSTHLYNEHQISESQPVANNKINVHQISASQPVAINRINESQISGSQLVASSKINQHHIYESKLVANSKINQNLIAESVANNKINQNHIYESKPVANSKINQHHIYESKPVANNRINEEPLKLNPKISTQELTKTDSVKLTQGKFNLDLTLMSCKANLNFNCVENYFFKNLFGSFCKFNLPSCSLLANYFDQLYNQIYTKVFTFLMKTEINEFSICFEILNDKIKQKNYIAFNLNFIKDKKLNSIMLKFDYLYQFRETDHLFVALNNLLKEFNLQNKNILYTAFDEEQNLISLTDKIRLTRFKCISHILQNLFSYDLLSIDKEFKNLLKKVLIIYKVLSDKLEFSEESTIGKILYDDQIEDIIHLNYGDLNDTSDNLKNDLSNDLFLERVHEFEVSWISIKHLFKCINSNKGYFWRALIGIEEIEKNLSNHDWSKLAKYTEFLIQISNFNDLLCNVNEPTLNLVLLLRSEIKCLINQFYENDELIRAVFLKAFEDQFKIEEIHVVAALLDPDLKNLKAIEEYLNEKKLTKSEFLYNFLKELDFDKISQQAQNVTKQVNLPNLKQILIQKHSLNLEERIKSNEIDIYLSLSKFEHNQSLIDFWIQNSVYYPTLSKLALMVLSVKSTQSITEETFNAIDRFFLMGSITNSYQNFPKLIFINTNFEFLKMNKIELEEIKEPLSSKRAQETSDDDVQYEGSKRFKNI